MVNNQTTSKQTNNYQTGKTGQDNPKKTKTFKRSGQSLVYKNSKESKEKNITSSTESKENKNTQETKFINTNVRKFTRRERSVNNSISRQRKFTLRNASKNAQRRTTEEQDNIENVVIDVRRVTKVVAGGKNMRFSALVVVGDRNGKVGYALAKGIDYQDSVNKAVKKAKTKLINLKLNENRSVTFPQIYKFKSCLLYLKPAHSGTGVIAGGFLRPILELAGVENIYTKLVGSRNKVTGVRAAIQALAKYTSN